MMRKMQTQNADWNNLKKFTVVKLLGLPQNAYITDVREFFEAAACPRTVSILGTSSRSVVFVVFSNSEHARRAVALSGRRIKGHRVQIYWSSSKEFASAHEQHSESSNSSRFDCSPDDEDRGLVSPRDTSVCKKSSSGRTTGNRNQNKRPAAGGSGQTNSARNAKRKRAELHLERVAALLRSQFDDAVKSIVGLSPDSSPQKAIETNVSCGSSSEHTERNELPVSRNCSSEDCAPAAVTDLYQEEHYFKMTGFANLPNYIDLKHFFFGLWFPYGAIRYVYNAKRPVVYLMSRDARDFEKVLQLNGAFFGTSRVEICRTTMAEFAKARVFRLDTEYQMPALRYNLPGSRPVLAGRAEPVPSDLVVLVIGLSVDYQKEDVRNALTNVGIKQIVNVPRKFNETVYCFVEVLSPTDFQRVLNLNGCHIGHRQVRIFPANRKIFQEICGERCENPSTQGDAQQFEKTSEAGSSCENNESQIARK